MLALGIDFGTTSSVVAYSQQRKVAVIEIDQSARSIPSCVSFADQERMVGEFAVHQSSRNPLNTVFDIKRLLGCDGKEMKSQKSQSMLPFSFERSNDGASYAQIKGKPKIQVQYMGETTGFYPEELVAMILYRIKEISFKYLEQPVAGAVFTVPSSFNAVQRKAIKDAAHIAGIIVLGLLNETTAAAISYETKLETNSKVTALIFHLGGGSFDVALATIKHGSCIVNASCGTTKLGGATFTANVLARCVSIFKENTKIDIANNPRAISRLRQACEKAKRDLSVSDWAKIKVDNLSDGSDFQLRLTESDFELWNEQVIKNLRDITDQVYKQGNTSKEEVKDIIVVGAASRMKIFQKLVCEHGEHKIRKTVNVNEAAALGAAVQAGYLSRARIDKRHDVRDLLSHTVKISFGDGEKEILFERGTPIPTTKWHAAATDRCSLTFAVYCEDAFTSDELKYGDYEYAIESDPTNKTVQYGAIKFEITADGLFQVGEYCIGGKVVLHRASEIQTVNESQELEILRRKAEGYQRQSEERKKAKQKCHQLEKYAYSVLDDIEKQTAISAELKAEISEQCDLVTDWILETSNPSLMEIEKSWRGLKSMKNDVISGEYQLKAETLRKIKQLCRELRDIVEKNPNILAGLEADITGQCDRVDSRDMETSNYSVTDLEKKLKDLEAIKKDIMSGEYQQKAAARQKLINECNEFRDILQQNPNISATLEAEISGQCIRTDNLILQSPSSSRMESRYKEMVSMKNEYQRKIQEAKKVQHKFNKLKNYLSKLRDSIEKNPGISARLRVEIVQCGYVDNWIRKTPDPSLLEIEKRWNVLESIESRVREQREVQQQCLELKKYASRLRDDIKRNTDLSAGFKENAAKQCDRVYNWISITPIPSSDEVEGERKGLESLERKALPFKHATKAPVTDPKGRGSGDECVIL